MSLVNSGIEGFLTKIFDDMITLFSTIVVYIMGNAQDVVNHPMIIKGILYAQGLALSYVVIKVVSEAVSTYILYTNGDSDSDPGGLLIRTIQSITIIAVLPWLVRWVYSFGLTLAQDVANLTGAQSTDLSLLSVGQAVTSLPVVFILIIIVAIVFIVLIFIQTLVRGAEFGLLSVIGAIMAVDLVTPGRSMYKLWLKELIAIGATQALQIFLLKASFYTLTDMRVEVPIYSLLKFLAWIWVTYKVPSYLKQFTYSSGMGGTAGGLTQSATSTMLARKILSKGVA